MLYAFFLALHILMGILGLLLGVGAMYAKKQKGAHAKLGAIYHWCFVGITITASVLAILDWERLWWFLPIGIFSYLFALLGFASAKLRFKNWLRLHLIGQGGSFIAMCTAVVVVNFGSANLFSWFVPTIIGTPILIWLAEAVKAGRRPKY